MEKITIILTIALFFGCSQPERKKSAIYQYYTDPVEGLDTSGFFVKRLLNCSPEEVAKVLGKPDGKIKASNDCDYLPNCKEATYKDKKYEVLYYDNKLKWIEINDFNVFDGTAIQYVGFPPCNPTFANEFMIHWRSSATRGTATGDLIPVVGIRQVAVLPSERGKAGYMIIEVETYYNTKF